VVEVGDVADGQPQNLDLGQLLVGRQRRQEFPQFGERDVERFDPDALARRVRDAVLERRAPPPAPLLARQVRRYFHFRFRLRVRGAVARRPDAAAARVHRLVGFDHVTVTASGRGYDVRGRIPFRFRSRRTVRDEAMPFECSTRSKFGFHSRFFSVGFDHVTAGSSRNHAVRGGVGAFAGGVPHCDGGLVKEGRVGRYRNDHARRVKVQRLMVRRHLVVAVAIVTAVIVVVIILMLIKLLLVMMVVMGIVHFGVDG